MRQALQRIGGCTQAMGHSRNTGAPVLAQIVVDTRENHWDLLKPFGWRPGAGRPRARPASAGTGRPLPMPPAPSISRPGPSEDRAHSWRPGVRARLHRPCSGETRRISNGAHSRTPSSRVAVRWARTPTNALPKVPATPSLGSAWRTGVWISTAPWKQPARSSTASNSAWLCRSGS